MPQKEHRLNTLVKLISLSVLSLFMFACGSSTPSVKTVEPVGPPWASLSAPEVNFYTEQAMCPAMTDLVVGTANTPGVTSWDAVPSEEGFDNPSRAPGDRWKVLRNLTNTTMYALEVYSSTDKGEKVTDSVFVADLGREGAVPIVLVDYHVLKDVRDGKVTDNTPESEFFGSATGEYFCLFAL